MQVVVERERVEFFLHTNCSPSYDDCTPKDNSDLKYWVEKAPGSVRKSSFCLMAQGENVFRRHFQFTV